MGQLCPFPAISMVESIKKKHAQAQFFEDENRIEFSRSECRKRNCLFCSYIIYHEIGHWFRYNHVPLSTISGRGREGFRILNCHDPEEGFADAFAAYFMEPDTLTGKHPEHQKRLADMLADHEDAIREFCDEITGWLTHHG